MTEHIRPIDPNPDEARRPKVRAPAGATDCHFHIFGDPKKYPLSPHRMYEPADASVERYLRMANTIGIERVVVVNGSPYGSDNRCIIDAIQEFGLNRARGVAVIEPDISAAALQALYIGGIRGIRINLITGRTPISALPSIVEMIKPLGMHLQLWVKSDRLEEISKTLQHIEVPVVLDHMGQVPTSYGTDHEHFRTLIGMLETGKLWVKMSGYRISSGPPYNDLLKPVSKILSVAPDRCVWGTDWPHPLLDGRAMPNDGDLLDLLASWCSPEQFKAVLVDNPARLYGF